MPRKRRLVKVRRAPLAEELEHFLLTGCYSAPAPEGNVSVLVFALAGQVIRGRLGGLRELWTEYGPEIKRAHRGRTFAETVLGGDERPCGRCHAHPEAA